MSYQVLATATETLTAGWTRQLQFYTHFYFIMAKVKMPPSPQQQPIKFIPKIKQCKTGLFPNLKQNKTKQNFTFVFRSYFKTVVGGK